MKLSRVVLKSPYRVPGSKMATASCDITEAECGPMHYDVDTGSLVFDDLGGFGINWDRVAEWYPVELKMGCQWCGESFKSKQALGGHAGHCKAKLIPKAG